MTRLASPVSAELMSDVKAVWQENSDFRREGQPSVLFMPSTDWVRPTHDGGQSAGMKAKDTGFSEKASEDKGSVIEPS